MRLLNVKTLQLETFYYGSIPQYAALSHTWGDEEVTFEDLTNDKKRKKKGWRKILASCFEAEQHLLEYIWIGTCCIDKSSSAELSEAINSMYAWYRDCNECLAYLEDVHYKPEEEFSSHEEFQSSLESALHSCRWFTRGWTLQELIAPDVVRFYDSEWNLIGKKRALYSILSKITKIDSDVLKYPPTIWRCNIAKRMSWASKRQTTRSEDLAYSLMGIFDINMPLLYGEGEKAFFRLQEEILKSTYDHSLFAWNLKLPNYERKLDAIRFWIGMGILAPHPLCFSSTPDIVQHGEKTQPYTMTNRGLQICLPILEPSPINDHSQYIGMLRCSHRQRLGIAVGISLIKSEQSDDEFYRDPRNELLEIDYETFERATVRNIYILGSGRPIPRREMNPPSYRRCWLRKASSEDGIKFHYAEYGKNAAGVPMVRGPWNGHCLFFKLEPWANLIRTGLYFSKDDAAFAAMVNFWLRKNGTREIGLRLQDLSEHSNGQLTHTIQCADEVFTAAWDDDLDFEHHPESTPISSTLPFQNGVVTARIQKRVIFGYEMFVIDIEHSTVAGKQEKRLKEISPF